MKIASIILAAGRGSRMSSSLPKVLQKINKKPLILHSLEKLKKLNLDKIIVVVGYGKDQVLKTIKDTEWIEQTELLGTGYATKIALSKIPRDIRTVMVVNGDDSVFYKPQTLKKIIDKHLKSAAKMTIVTSIQDRVDISGRVIRDEKGRILQIKPNSKMSHEELQREKEVICGLYLFDRNWMEKELPRVEKGKAGEYNLTTLIDFALAQDKLLDIRLKDPNEWRSINTPRELKAARALWRNLYGN